MSQEIKDALLKLDPKVKEHWTNDGLPAVAALGITGLTRAAITEVAPQFTKDNPTLDLPPEIKDEQQELIEADLAFVMEHFEAEDAVPSGEREDGATIFSLIDTQHTVITEGTLLELINKAKTLTTDEDEDNEEKLQGQGDEEANDKEETSEEKSKEEKVEEGLPPTISDAPRPELNFNDREALLAEKKAALEKIDETGKALTKAQAVHDEAQRAYDDIENKLEAALKGRTTQHDIMDFIKSQGKLREQKAARTRSFMDAGIDLNAIGPAPIDKAMSRKTSRGATRPQRTV